MARLATAGAVSTALAIAPLDASAEVVGWAVVPSANVSGTASYLNGTTCAAAGDCWAVGDYPGDNGFTTLIEEDSGNGWNIVASPNVGPYRQNALQAVACATSTHCIAVGHEWAGGPDSVPLIEENTGSGWTIVPSPGSAYSLLHGVTCASASVCWAVGAYETSNGLLTLIEENAGAGWTIVPSPNVGANDELSSVTCASLTECWAVGDYQDGSNQDTLIEEYTGAAWTVVSSPNLGTDDHLYGVTCATSSHCWAVGHSYTSGSTLIEDYSGGSWTVATGANVASSDDSLYGIACATADDCWAVGVYRLFDGQSEGPDQTLIEENSGSGWAVTPSPSTGSGLSDLYGVTCATSTDCTAVGNDDYNDPTYGSSCCHTLVEQTSTAPVVTTTPASSTIVLSQATTDAALVTGDSTNGSPTGTVTFSVCGPPASASGCSSGGTAVGSPVTLVPGANDTSTATSSGFTPTAPGTWCFHAGYSGSATYGASADNGLNECFNVDKAGTALVTTPTSSSILIGQSNTDGATVTGNSVGGSPTGSMTFYACGPLAAPGNCAGGTNIGTAALTVGADNTATVKSPSFTPSARGIWCFRGEYGGDANYTGSNDQGAHECFGVGVLIQDTAPSAGFDSWRGVVSSSANGGTYRTSPAAGATARLTFSATGVTWVTRKGPDQGIASVTIDGVNKGNVDLYVGGAQAFSKSYSGLASGSHAILITVTGSKDSASTGTKVAVDAFIYGNATVQDGAISVVYDNWYGVMTASASGGTYRATQRNGSTATLTFTGRRLDWITATSPSDGKATVTIDGVSKGTFDLYAASVHWRVTLSFTGLSAGTHTVVVHVLGTKDSAANGAFVDIDAFIAY